jgi:hypothetical protein
MNCCGLASRYQHLVSTNDAKNTGSPFFSATIDLSSLAARRRTWTFGACPKTNRHPSRFQTLSQTIARANLFDRSGARFNVRAWIIHPVF